MYREDDNTPFYFRESPITDCIGLGKQSFCLIVVSIAIKKTVIYVGGWVRDIVKTFTAQSGRRHAFPFHKRSMHLISDAVFFLTIIEFFFPVTTQPLPRIEPSVTTILPNPQKI